MAVDVRQCRWGEMVHTFLLLLGEWNGWMDGNLLAAAAATDGDQLAVQLIKTPIVCACLCACPCLSGPIQWPRRTQLELDFNLYNF